jgi:hypothetical protein
MMCIQSPGAVLMVLSIALRSASRAGCHFLVVDAEQYADQERIGQVSVST